MVGGLTVKIEVEGGENDNLLDSTNLHQSLDSTLGNSQIDQTIDRVRRKRISNKVGNLRKIKEYSEIEQDNLLEQLDDSELRLQEQNDKLNEHFNKLNEKLLETDQKMDVKKNIKPAITAEEEELNTKLNENFTKLNRLVRQSNTLKNHLTGETAYERIKELENVIFVKEQENNKVNHEIGLIDDMMSKQQKAFQETMEEKGYKEKLQNLDKEIDTLKKQVKTDQKMSTQRIDKERSINNVTLLLESKYRELCEKHNYVDRLKMTISRSENNLISGVQITSQQLQKLNRRDPNKPLIRKVDSTKLLKRHYQTETLKREA